MASTYKLMLMVIVSALMYTLAETCSCMLFHPQEHYCSADFVAVVQVKRIRKGDGNVNAYQIRTKKIFKANQKAQNALTHGLLWANTQEILCGLHLNRKRYLVAGRVKGEKPWVSLCNFVQEWSTLSRKQRKGFRLLYRQGCQCTVRTVGYMKISSARYSKKDHYCSWETAWSDKYDCQGKHSLCVPSPHHKHKCTWVNNSSYKHCMKRSRKMKEARDP